MIGTTLSHFRITDKLGEGGMGEVWLAEDTRLGRNVALKILPPERGESEDRRRRFEDEARAASALNHPGIAHIYDVGEADGIHFIAMEHVDGESLDQRMATDAVHDHRDRRSRFAARGCPRGCTRARASPTATSSLPIS